MSSIFCVTGMHRSGTSLLMSWLEKCGLQISDGGLVPDGTGNITGHFEDQEFYELHLKTISKAIPGSKGWIVTNKHDLGKLSLDHKDMTDILLTRNKRYPLWGWKDPRSSGRQSLPVRSLSARHPRHSACRAEDGEIGESHGEGRIRKQVSGIRIC